MKLKSIISGSLIIAAIFSSCSLSRGALTMPKEVEVPLILNTEDVQRRYTELEYGIRLNVATTILNSQIIDMSELPEKTRKQLPTYNVTPALRQYVTESMSDYARNLGIPVNTSLRSDYTLNVNVTVFKLRWNSSGATATVTLEYSLEDSDHKMLIARTSSSGRVFLDNNEQFTNGLSRAYLQALKNIDWDRIASYLKVHKSASQEKQRSVEGEGNTALEHTVIRWYVISSPQGADVSWRVVSSTPDVKNTNSTYLGTTPYETTESFDIRGLSYENSGNVQIEITCEKPGYLPQKRRFNVRQAIDQKEVSAKFNLVKDE